jgi:type 1 glutamine amidotransferase
MTKAKCFLFVLVAMVLAAPPVQAQEADEAGFKPIFNGTDLTGWDGDPKFWRVEDGVVVSQTTKENPTDGNTFLIWRKGQVGDFDLIFEYKIVGGNSGVQYRSFEVPDKKWVIGGYQGDFEAGDRYSGILYGERFRGILCDRGQKTVIGADHKPKVVGSVGDSDELQKKIKKEDWNEYEIIARGFHFIHKINGHVTADCTDEDGEMRRKTGILALQLHAGPPMKVQFRDFHLKVAPPVATKNKKGKKIVFVAGKASHGYGAHEHKAGCLLLAKAIEQNLPGVETQVITNGWPQDASVLEDADTIVSYADGGGGHPFFSHLEEVNRLMKKGVGLVCIHYAVEVPKGPAGERFLDWTGGYFEPHWSVNPHWTADYKKFPEHEITRGVKPFLINDEWYYHMRFRPEMEGVTPILTALPPKDTLSRPDGTHSGNPDVRAAIERGEPQHMAWARERPDGGRGFGISGGHVHWNWGHDGFRKLVLNAIAWTAHVEVPANGVSLQPLTVEDLEANQDEQPPADHNPARIQKMLDDWRAETGA